MIGRRVVAHHTGKSLILVQKVGLVSITKFKQKCDPVTQGYESHEKLIKHTSQEVVSGFITHGRYGKPSPIRPLSSCRSPSLIDKMIKENVYNLLHIYSSYMCGIFLVEYRHWYHLMSHPNDIHLGFC